MAIFPYTTTSTTTITADTINTSTARLCFKTPNFVKIAKPGDDLDPEKFFLICCTYPKHHNLMIMIDPYKGCVYPHFYESLEPWGFPEKLQDTKIHIPHNIMSEIEKYIDDIIETVINNWKIVLDNNGWGIMVNFPLVDSEVTTASSDKVVVLWTKDTFIN